MYIIGVRGFNGKVSYVSKLRKRKAETTSVKSLALQFYSIEELKSEYNNFMGQPLQLDLSDNYVSAFIIKV